MGPDGPEGLGGDRLWPGHCAAPPGRSVLSCSGAQAGDNGMHSSSALNLPKTPGATHISSDLSLC